MDSSKLLVAFALVITVSISYDHLSGIGISAIVPPQECFKDKPCNFAPEEASSTLCFNPCTVKLGDKECKTICLNKTYKDGSCIGFGITPSSKLHINNY
ncbi:unnamed protein product [Eruca vesicaria subsp. sativa]|uniref:Defensin-like domain-containing protein n=1 Tax=Eruca vesicaria subsp. sativa TaxID=29727 RepID=A0ABC8KWM8_ERUVS|nr:unnamed protein product [Eruca vesicaria subsp. sativa]